MHKGKKLAKGGFDHDSFDPSEEEVIPAEDMEKLVAFADGTYPPWGDHVREWTDFEKVIAVCYFDEEWATVEINFGNQQLVIHDPRSSEFKDEDVKKRLNHFIAMARLVPQIMKEIGGFQKRNIRIPQYGQWEIIIAPPTAPESDIWRPKKNKADSALYCLRYVEKMLARGPESPHTLRNNDELKAYRHHIAQAIFYNSTDPVPLQQLVERMCRDETRLF